MTVWLDPDGTSYSDAACFRCEQAGPHWASRHSTAGFYACRRCFATFADQESAPLASDVDGIDLLLNHHVPLAETK